MRSDQECARPRWTGKPLPIAVDDATGTTEAVPIEARQRHDPRGGVSRKAAGKPLTARQRQGPRDAPGQGPNCAPAATARDLLGHHRRRPRSLTTLAGAAGAAGSGGDDGREPLPPCLQRLGFLVLILMQVVGADDTGWPMCKDCFRDVVRHAELRQPGAADAAQVVVGPVRQCDGVVILAAATGHPLSVRCMRRCRSALIGASRSEWLAR